jgi:hypothetical protein
MHPKTHARMMNIFIYVGPIMFFLLFILAIFLSKYFPGKGIDCLPLVFIPIMVVIFLMIRNLPIYCDKPGCNGRMMITKTRVSSDIVQFDYQCAICENDYKAEINQPEIKPGGSGGHGGGGP